MENPVSDLNTAIELIFEKNKQNRPKRKAEELE